MVFLKKIISKICVIVGVIFCLGFLSQFFPFLNGFIVDTYAQEDVPFKVGVLNTSGSNTTVTGLDGTFSNFFENANQNSLNTFQYYLFGVDTSTCQEDSCDLVADPVRQWYSYNDLTDNLEFNYPYQHSTDVTYMGSLSYTFTKQFKLTNSNHYSIMLAIYKSSNDIRFNTNLNPNLTGLNITIGQGTSERQILSSVDNLDVKHTIYTDRNNSQSHWASITVEFDTNSNFESLGNNEDIYLSSLMFDINTPQEGWSNISYPFNNVLYFPSNKSSDVYIKNYLYVIENGSIFYTLDGMPFGEEYDFTSYEDINVINSIPTCSDNITSLSDIGCHIKRVFTMIEKFFIRISNFFKELLKSITQSLTPQPHTLAEQYFQTFHLEDGGVSTVISKPLEFISDFNTTSCQPISLSLGSIPITLPCMTSIYISKFNTIFTIYQAITTGLICYYCCLNMFLVIKKLQAPDNDKVEVLDL